VADASKALLTDLLKQVSRSFYLTLRVLPRAVRPQIGLAYLLARTTDTIADTEILPLQERLNALAKLRERILDCSRRREEADALTANPPPPHVVGYTPLDFGELAQQQGLPAERTLLERVEDSLALLRTLSPEDLTLVRRVIDTITGGQELDLMRFGTSALTPNATNDGRARPTLRALQTDTELDDYTYRVAGCVGEFWTKMCRAHLFPDAKLDDAQLLADGVRFGKGLQLVNILRDLPRDLPQGRCYIPLERLARVGLQPEDLLRPETEKKFRPAYDELLAQAEAHLKAGWNYTNTVPSNQWRVRLACAWPILIGLRTIELLRAGNPLDPAQRIKISRADVRGIVWCSLIRAPFPRAFRNLWPD
jgi:farnesyl-diphosphate farnesyltransferase